MATVHKDALYPGTVYPPGLDEAVQFTGEDLAEGFTTEKGVSIPFLHRRAKEMLAEGLQIPFSWEHQPRAVPMTAADLDKLKAEKTRLALGHVSDVSLHADGYLETALEVEDEADRQALPKVRFVSPAIRWNYKDGAGKVWPGPSIMHVAATMRPVQHHQKPFKLAMEQDGIRLSMADYHDVNLGDPPMAEKVAAKDESADAEGTSDIGKKLKKALELLKDHELVLGDDTVAEMEPFLDRLIVALETKKAGETEEDDMSVPDEKPAEVSETPQIAMSMQVANSVTARAMKRERKDLETRIRAAHKSGRMDKPTADGLLGRLKEVQLSFDADGELVCKDNFVATLQIHEGLRAGAYFPAESRMSMDVEPVEVLPRERDGKIDSAREQEILDEVYGKLPT